MILYLLYAYPKVMDAPPNYKMQLFPSKPKHSRDLKSFQGDYQREKKRIFGQEEELYKLHSLYTFIQVSKGEEERCCLSFMATKDGSFTR